MRHRCLLASSLLPTSSLKTPLPPLGKHHLTSDTRYPPVDDQELSLKWRSQQREPQLEEAVTTLQLNYPRSTHQFHVHNLRVLAREFKSDAEGQHLSAVLVVVRYPKRKHIIERHSIKIT